MQGTVAAQLKCAIQMDTLGRYCYSHSTGQYQYRDVCTVVPLGMIDDIAGVAECNTNSLILNSIINAKIESMMKKKDCEVYLGEIISSSGSNEKNIIKAWGLLAKYFPH